MDDYNFLEEPPPFDRPDPTPEPRRKSGRQPGWSNRSSKLCVNLLRPILLRPNLLVNTTPSREQGRGKRFYWVLPPWSR